MEVGASPGSAFVSMCISKAATAKAQDVAVDGSTIKTAYFSSYRSLCKRRMDLAHALMSAS